MTWLLDCDGVVWLAEQVIPGAPEAVARLRASGVRVVFLTNNSYPRRPTISPSSSGWACRPTPEDILSSAMAAASLLEAGERALVLGGPGVIEELTARGVGTVVAGAPPRPEAGAPVAEMDAVVVGMDPSFDYASLAAAATALHAGARLIGTNDDATFPAPGAVLPGAGSLLAAVARAGQAEPIFAGKPYPPTVGLVHERIGEVEIVVGDRPSTDGVLARRLGARFGLVLTGVTPPATARSTRNPMSRRPTCSPWCARSSPTGRPARLSAGAVERAALPWRRIGVGVLGDIQFPSQTCRKRRDETGMEEGMKEPYTEGVATHGDPE